MRLVKFSIFGLFIHSVIAVPNGSELTDLKKSLRRSAAITIPGLFDFMIGHHPTFAALKVPYFKFPHKIDRWELELRDERHFIEFLLRNQWVQRAVGIKMKNSNGLFPDIKGEIFDGSKIPIKVEVEYWAENYKEHNHRFGGCDLILSFFRQPETRIVRGVPVWSFYVGSKTNRDFTFCLTSDMNYNFQQHQEKAEQVSKEKKSGETKFFDGRYWRDVSTMAKIFRKKR